MKRLQQAQISCNSLRNFINNQSEESQTTVNINIFSEGSEVTNEGTGFLNNTGVVMAKIR
jgi:hypothetical protein